MPNTDQKHADMCVAFHERLVEALRELTAGVSHIKGYQRDLDEKIAIGANLLVEIEKASQ